MAGLLVNLFGAPFYPPAMEDLTLSVWMVYLTPEEQAANDQFTPCCSRSKSPRLVLDL
ncbi:hypothetical protein [Polaromonas sp.]|uniref:hypothetical protein n=1 Tax=Polaromonas sp. TaxID=1869339 RepID=UPI003BB4A0AA